MRKPGLGSLLLLGAAAFGAYKYSKMSAQQKTDLKNKGKKFVDENLGSLKMFLANAGRLLVPVLTMVVTVPKCEVITKRNKVKTEISNIQRTAHSIPVAAVFWLVL